MVLFKRKPVQLTTNTSHIDDNTEVWLIECTGEVFTHYEAYLQRIDFYKQKRFICEITGRSNLTFFDAHNSEIMGADWHQMSSSEDLSNTFPESLQEPVLRKLQFSTISRIDILVDQLFEEFKQDFYPGERVTVDVDHAQSKQKLSGIVREKAKFPELRKPDGTLERKAFSRYFVKISNQPDYEALVDTDHIIRDRRAFTKQRLRSFIKNAVTRESWTGAPWLVKPAFAARFRIDTDVPAHLRVSAKKTSVSNKTPEKTSFNGGMHAHSPLASRLPQLQPAPKSHKSKQLQAQFARSKLEQFNQAIATSSNMQANGEGKYTSTFNGNIDSIRALAVKPLPRPSLPLPPPPIKYPIEDLEIVPVRDGTHRPPLKYLSRDIPAVDTDTEILGENDILMKSVGLLLETWDTLNVYCEVFVLDSFTFDDYVQALKLTPEDDDCELLDEIHCSVLKKIVDDEKDGGKINVSLPELPDDLETEEDSTIAHSAKPSPSPEAESKPHKRTTRSSLAKAEAAAVRSRSRSLTNEVRTHQAVEMLGDYSWVDRLRKREFRNGGWQVILVGLLYQLSLSPKRKDFCEKILSKLAPLDMEPSIDTAKSQYASLDINLRVNVIQIICMLMMGSQAIRGYMEECSEEMTTMRKNKIQWQRQRKQILEELRTLNDERKILLPSNPVPVIEIEVETNGDTKMGGIDHEEEEQEETPGTDEETPHKGRSLRRANDREIERKRKREEGKQKKEKAEAAAKVPKLSPRFKKILAEIEKKKEGVKECEEKIMGLDDELRESDCPRTRVLGKDRFWNRYYWFERNGMPFAGIPSSSTAFAGYANGCIWVQGPCDLEREGFINVTKEEQDVYYHAFQMTIPERKKLEEGPTSVFNADQWGYYEDPDSVDRLIGWLDMRGVREVKLRKELQLYREKICSHMNERKKYLAGEPSSGGGEEHATRASTRSKPQTDKKTPRCMAWKNLQAIQEIGHLHSEPPLPRKKPVKKAGKRESASTKKARLSGRSASRLIF